MKKVLVALLFIASTSMNLAQGEILYSIFSYNKSGSKSYPKNCLALIVWNDAAKKVFKDPMPTQFCKWILGIQAPPLLDEKLKRKGLATGYSTDRLIVFNTTPNLTNAELMQLIIDTTQ